MFTPIETIYLGFFPVNLSYLFLLMRGLLFFIIRKRLFSISTQTESVFLSPQITSVNFFSLDNDCSFNFLQSIAVFFYFQTKLVLLTTYSGCSLILCKLQPNFSSYYKISILYFFSDNDCHLIISWNKAVISFLRKPGHFISMETMSDWKIFTFHFRRYQLFLFFFSDKQKLKKKTT